MKQTNLILTAMLAIALCFTACSSSDDEPIVPEIASGTAGSLTWTLTEDGTLTISGNGTMLDYDAIYNSEANTYLSTVPWSSHINTITKVVIANGVTSIGEVAFAHCTGLTSIDVATDNPNYTSEGGVLFNKTKTTLVAYPAGKGSSYTVPSSVTSIGNTAFQGCTGLTSITLPSSLTSIGNSAFVYCTGLTSITLPSSLTSLGERAFYNCTGLTSITLPSSLTSIGNSAFLDCTGLTEITVEAIVPPAVSTNTFYNVSRTIPVYVPVGSLAAYQSANYWKEFTNIIGV